MVTQDYHSTLSSCEPCDFALFDFSFRLKAITSNMVQQSYIPTLLGVVFVAAKASAQLPGLDSELGTKWETFKKEFGKLNHYELLICVLSATHDTATIEPTSPIGPSDLGG